MPRQAICSGFVDYILPPEGIAEELVRVGESRALVTPSSEDDGHLEHLLRLLQSATGVDHGYYRRAHLRCHVDRRLLLHRIERLEDYVAYTREHAKELVALHHDLLFHFTRFFHDRAWFDALASTVFRGLVARRPFEPLRIWVPGCSTGEEAYSMAMLALEALGATKTSPSRDVEIFGTDLSEVAIEQARAGRYPEGIAADVTRERLERFFVKEDGGYRIQPFVREVCAFGKHDLIRDP